MPLFSVAALTTSLPAIGVLAVSAGVVYITWHFRSMFFSNEESKLDLKLLNNQSYRFPGKEKILGSNFVKDGPMIDTVFGKCSTLHEVFQFGMNRKKGQVCLGWRPTSKAEYEWMTYEEAYAKATRLGAGIRTFKLDGWTDIFCVGIYATNCVEWALTQQACSSFGFVIVPLYDTLGEPARKHIIRQTEMSLCLCDSAERVRNIVSDNKDTGDHVKHIILIGHVDELEGLRAEVFTSSDGQIQLHSFNEVLDLGPKNAQPDKLPSPDDLHLLCYTSGTTGLAKGVMITHRMIVSVVAGFEAHTNAMFTPRYKPNFTDGDFYLSYLPLAHVFEQIVMHYMFGRGAGVGFFSGDLKNLSDDIMTLRPTVFCAVPRVLQRLHGFVQSAVHGSRFKTWLLNTAVEAKMRLVRQGIITRNTLWDKYVLKKIQDRMGGRLRVFACGSAPISPELYHFCQASLGAYSYEAYGLTETCGAMIMTITCDPVAGHTGAPLPCCMVKLIDVPDMDIIVERDNAGEICVKGPSVTKGYYKDPEKTAEVIDADGWLHTGDIGRINERGTVQLIDRCKNMFKLAQGEYVSPEKVEMVYAQSNLINQIFVDGKSSESFAIAICVPQMDMLRKALDPPPPISTLANGTSAVVATNGDATANSAHMSNGNSSNKTFKAKTLSDKKLCESKEARIVILHALNKLGKEQGLKGFEQAKSIFLRPNEFTVEEGLLTPTQKKVRIAFRRTFKDEVEKMYKEQMIT